MAIDAKTVAELRRRTGLPMMKCKEALEAAGADLTLAEENLRKEGFKTIDKLKDREMKEGLVFIAEDKGTIAAVAVLCETDFVARSADVQQFGEMLAKGVLADAPSDRGMGDALEGLKLADKRTVKDHLEDLVGKRIRENMKSIDRNTDLYNRYVKKFTDQEDRIETLRDEAVKLEQQVVAAQRSLDDYLSKLNLS